MSKSIHLFLVLSLLPGSIAMLGCGGGDDEPREVVEEYPGQFREMAIEAAADEEDQQER